ncbi:MAG: hypothetical protein AAB446_00285 [Patescibacteria group bacterium]
MKKRLFIYLPILLLASVVFLGCSLFSNKGNNTGGTGNNPNNPTKPNTYDGFGYDDNANKVWDDLDRYIANRYPNDINKQSALNQMAKALQTAVKAGNSGDDSAAQSARAALSKANYCLLEKMGNAEAMNREGSLLDVEMLKGDSNRGKAYQEFNALLSGGFYGSDQRENPCEQ